MGVKLYTGIVRKSHLLEDLLSFFEDFDADVTGQNGENCIDPDAAKEGFDSSIAYYVDLFQKGENDSTPITVVEKVLKAVGGSYHSGGFIGADSTAIEINDEIVVSFAYGDK